MNLTTVMAQVATRLDAISGLRTYPFPPDAVSPPAAIVSYPDEITFDETYGRGMDRMTVPVVLVVGRPTDRTAALLLGEYAAGSGARSVKAVLESGTYSALHTLRVMRAEFDVVTIAGQDHMAARFDLDITGEGASS